VSTKLYVDVHVRIAISNGLRVRGVDVLTAQEDGAGRLGDPDLLDRAAEMGRILFTQDADLLSEATRRQRGGLAFGGVIYAHQLNVTIAQCIDGLELIAKASEPEEWASRVEYLPLK